MRSLVAALVGTHCCTVTYASRFRVSSHVTEQSADNVTSDDAEWPALDVEKDSHGIVKDNQVNHFFTALNSSGVRVGSGRPACAHHLPVNSPYWNQQESYGISRNDVCKYKGCPGLTNAKRVASLRSLLKATNTLMTRFKAEYFIYAGTAVGQQRCGDVLPWDKDNDVLVRRHDLLRIHQLIFGRSWASTRGKGPGGYNTYSPDLRPWGAPGFKLVRYTECILFKLVDSKTGFATDIFPLDENKKGIVLTPWPGGPHHCSSWVPCSTGCYGWKRSTVFPVRTCVMSGIRMKCARDQARFLVAKYGKSVLTTPDVKVNTR